MATALDLLMSAKEDVNLLSEESDICTIDAKTRVIFVPSTIVVGGVQSDKNAERIKFSCPKIVGDNLDLSKFSVRINFENVSSVDFNVSIKDQYICDDVAVDGENITFSWLIGRNAARYMGTVRFIVCAVKTDSDSNISVEWNTAIAEVPVLEGIEIDQPQIGQEEKDVINQLLELTKNTSAEAVQNVNSAKEQAIKDIQSVSQPDTTLTIEGGLAEAKATGEAIGSLKEELGNAVGVMTLKFVKGYYIGLDGNFANVKSPVKSDDWEYLTCECIAGDKLTLTGAGGVSPRLWAFANSDGQIIQRSEVSAVEKKLVVAAPENATIFVMNNKTTYSSRACYKGAIKLDDIGYTENYVSGYYNFENLNLGDVAPQSISNGNAVCKKISCSPGDIYRITGVGTQNAWIYSFLDETDKIVESTLGYKALNGSIVITPENAKTLIVNFVKIAPYSFQYIGNIVRFSKIGTRSVVKIAALNSSTWDKNDSLLVCDGENDAYTINRTIEILSNNGGGKIILKKGRYYVKKLTDKNCIDCNVKNSVIEIESEIPNYNRTNSEGQEANSGAQLYMTNELYESLNSDTQYTFFNCSGVKYDGGIILKNFGIVFPHNQKQIIGLDFKDFNGMCRVEGIYINAYNKDYEPNVSIGVAPAKAAYNCIGIRTICKTSLGAIGTQFKNCIVKGCWEGIAVNGEHTVLDRCAAIFCVVGYTFDHYRIDGESAQHENLLIRCMDERNLSLPHFYYNGNKQAIIILGLNIERKQGNAPGGEELGKLAYEDNPGNHHGEITYTIAVDGDTSNVVYAPFWTDGHGHGFRSTNLLHLQACDTTTRKKYKPNYMQRIYDTTLNKEVICIDESIPKWVDAMGNEVD